MGMMHISSRALRALSFTLCPLPQAGEGNGLSRAARDVIYLEGALEWE
jgi:hypothetical protein